MRKGQKRSVESRTKQSDALKKRWAQPEYRARMVAARTGKKQSPETRAKRRVLMKEKWASPDFRARMVAAQKGKRLTPQTRAKIGAAHRGKMITPRARAAQSKAMREKWRSAEFRAKVLAARRGRKQSQETRARRSAAMRERWASPGYKDRLIVAHKKRWAIIRQGVIDEMLSGEKKVVYQYKKTRFGKRRVPVVSTPQIELGDAVKRALTDALNSLPDLQRRIVDMAFGLTGGSSLAFGEIAKRLGISERTVKQQYTHSIRRLAHNRNLRWLAGR